jgi:D-glucosaminate-6-phosphate ammonia-lyase
MTGRGRIYRQLGVEPIINGSSTLTILGGSLMPAEVLDAMREAADSFVDLTELQRNVGSQIAELTHNEAAFVSSGASAGLVLASIVCMLRNDPTGIWTQGQDAAGLPREFLIQALHRNPYDPALELAGGRLREFGTREGTTAAQLESAITDQTAAVVFAPNWPIANWPVGADHFHLAERALPLERVAEIAHARGIPVVVDAASQLPPRDNLWKLTAAGADMAVFSGGKSLHGPASSGLILGKRAFIDRCAANSAPLHRVGRPFKVGKEEMVGLLYAVRRYMTQDLDADLERCENIVEHLIEWGNARDDVVVIRDPIGPDGHPIPRAHVTLRADLVPVRDEILRRLRSGRPRIELSASRSDGLWINPHLLEPGEERQISTALGSVLDDLSGHRGHPSGANPGDGVNGAIGVRASS